MSISLLHHNPAEITLPCSLSTECYEYHAHTRNISMGGVWLVIDESTLEGLNREDLGECHIEIDGYRLDIPSHFTQVYGREILVEFLTLTVEQKVILGFILSKQHCTVGASKF